MGWHPYSGAASYIYANDHLQDDVDSDATSTIASSARHVYTHRVPRGHHFHARGYTEPAYTPRRDPDDAEGSTVDGSPRLAVTPILRHPFAASVPQVATVPPPSVLQSHRYNQLSVSTDDTRVEVVNTLKQEPSNVVGRSAPVVRFDVTFPDEREITWRRRVRVVKRKMAQFGQGMTRLITRNWVIAPRPRLSMIEP